MPAKTKARHYQLKYTEDFKKKRTFQDGWIRVDLGHILLDLLDHLRHVVERGQTDVALNGTLGRDLIQTA